MANIMIICAHPDDETLGAGGSLASHAKRGDKIMALVLATGQFGRDNSKKGILKRKSQCKKACTVLGIDKLKFLDYDDQKLEQIPLTELSCNIEKEIKSWKPFTIYTHFWGDANQDHRRVYEAVLISTRPTSKFFVKNIFCFETPSSTDWPVNPNSFQPNLFININKHIDSKIKAFSQYSNEIERFPGLRSKKSLYGRAQFWGSKIGVEYAESFVIIRKVEN